VSLAFTILGCGSSGGVPRVAQGWGACDAQEPRNRRRRCSALVERAGASGRTQVLIDASPDLREQLIGAEVARLDGVLLTHPHADHTHGIDDLRPITIATRRRVEIHMDAPTSADVRTKFAYIFETPAGSSYPPIAAERRLTPGVEVEIGGPGGAIAAMPFTLVHGDIPALGLRIGGLAYTPDLNAVPDAATPYLEGLDVWVIDALRYAPHPSHLSLSEALAMIERFRPKRAVLTNLHTDLDYATLTRTLPPGVTPAYDGLRIEGF
jgi:phosphoribosyl 1,2-cyclic phosphate phosphodiesterase